MLAVLFICALISSIISGIIGMGGGILLLTLMMYALPYQFVIPIHGLIQLTSNSSRSWYLRKHIVRSYFISFLLGAPFGLFVAYNILNNIKDSKWPLFLLSLFIIYVVFKPKKIPEIRLNKYGWFFLGILAGIQGPILGATGPLIAPFFSRSDLKKEEIVATKASLQIVIHFFKLPLFLTLGFNYIEHLDIIITMSIAALLGTYIGVHFLKKIKTEHFQILFKSILLISAVKLIKDFTEWILI